MKAITFTEHGLPIDDPRSLIDVNIEAPQPGPRDLLVEVQAVAVNPVDTKVRSGTFAKEPKILGWDAAGIVRQVGADVTLFKPGDAVYYAGSLIRSGSYSEFQVVDERIVGHRPRTLDAAHAAALPLTSITAWELLFDRLGVTEGGGEGDVLLVVGAGGGVGFDPGATGPSTHQHDGDRHGFAPGNHWVGPAHGGPSCDRPSPADAGPAPSVGH
jgi:zinc-binding alcohol dehydrogenase family protein